MSLGIPKTPQIELASGEISGEGFRDTPFPFFREASNAPLQTGLARVFRG
jgi:hypothetical protein